MTVNKQYFTMIQVRNALEKIADRMAEDKWEPDVIMGINRGGCIPGVYLSHRLKKEHLVLDIRLRDHKATPDLSVLTKQYAFQRKILIIDDINDSGNTIGIIKDLSKHLTTKIHFAVLINKSESKSKVEYFGKTVNTKPHDHWYVFPWENWWKIDEK